MMTGSLPAGGLRQVPGRACALGLCLTSQAASGLVSGLLAMRTRSLIASSVAHTIRNLFG